MFVYEPYEVQNSEGYKMNTFFSFEYPLTKQPFYSNILFELKTESLRRNNEKSHTSRCDINPSRSKDNERIIFYPSESKLKKKSENFSLRTKSEKRMSKIEKLVPSSSILIFEDMQRKSEHNADHILEYSTMDSRNSKVSRSIITQVNKIYLPDIINIKLEGRIENLKSVKRNPNKIQKNKPTDKREETLRENRVSYSHLTLEEKILLRQNSIRKFKKIISSGKNCLHKIFTPLIEKGKKVIGFMNNKDRSPKFHEIEPSQFTDRGYSLLYDEFIFHMICKIIEYVRKYRSSEPLIFRSCTRTKNSIELLEIVKEDWVLYCKELFKHISKCNNQNLKKYTIDEKKLPEISKQMERANYLITDDLLSIYTGSDLAYVCMTLFKNQFKHFIDYETANSLYEFYSQKSKDGKDAEISSKNMKIRFKCMKGCLLNLLEPRKREIFVKLTILFSEIESNYEKSRMRTDTLIKSTLDFFFSKKFLFSKKDENKSLLNFIQFCGRDNMALLRKMKEKMTFSVKFCDYLSTLDPENIKLDLMKK